MGRKWRQLGPFLGWMTSVNPADIPEGYAQDMQNVRIEDGKLTTKWGDTLLKNAALTAPYGIDHVLGYSGTTEVEEYISFLTTSGNVRAHSILAGSPYTVTEITNGGSGVNLNASDWRSVAFEDTAYLINPNNTPSVYKHTIGTNTSLSGITVPSRPTSALTYRAKFSSTSYTTYDVISFAGMTATNATHISGTGVLSATAGGAAGANTDASLSGNWIKLRFYSVGVLNGLDGSVTIDLNYATTGVKDWSYNDIFAFALDFDRQDMEEGSLTVSLINNDGSPIEVTATNIQAIKTSETAPPFGHQIWHVRAEFKDKVRTDWDNIRKIKISFRLVSGQGYDPAFVTISQFTVGCVDCSHYPASVQDNLQFTYSYYDSATGLESERIGKFIGTTPYSVIVTNATLAGKQSVFKTDPLGAWIELTTVATSGADKVRLYSKEQNGWHLLTTQDDTTLTYLYRMTIDELRALETASSVGGDFTNMVGAFPFKGWMVWLKKGGASNVLHSRVGSPLRLSSNVDPLDDDLRGATFSLADNFGDEPVCGFQAGDAAILLGKYGAYAQIGERPSTMTPCSKIPGSFGVANQFAACRWRDAEGNPGVAFVAKNMAGVFFIKASPSFEGDKGFPIVELSSDIRPSINEYFSASTVRLIADDANDALWIIGDDDAFVLRRPSIVNGQRMWERYKYQVSWSYAAHSTKRGKVALTSDTKLYQLDATSSYNAVGTYTGTTTYLSYWRSKDYAGPNRRVIRAMAHPAIQEAVNGTYMVASVEGCDRTASYNYVRIGSAVPPGERHGRFGFKTQGWQFSYQLSYNENSAGGVMTPLQRCEFEELTTGNRGLS